MTAPDKRSFAVRILPRRFRGPAASRIAFVAVAVLALAGSTGIAIASSTGDHGHGRRVELSSDVERLDILRCVGYEPVQLTIENPSTVPTYTDVFVKAQPPLRVSRDGVSTYLPAGYRMTVPLKVSVPPDIKPGDYKLDYETGDSAAKRHRVTVRVSAPADRQCVPGQRMVATATNGQANYGPEKAIDGDPATFWHSTFSPPQPLPQSITLDLGGVYDLTELRYRPRADGNLTGNITGYTIAASTDGTQFTPVTSGVWANDATQKAARFTARGVRALRLEATAGHNNLAAVAELVQLGVPVDVPVATATGLDAPATMAAGTATPVKVTVRNWTAQPVDATASVDVPAGWTATAPARATVPPNGQVAVPVTVTPPAGLPAAGPAPAVTLTAAATTTKGRTDGRPTATTWVTPNPGGATFALDSGVETSPVLDGWTRLAPSDSWRDGAAAGWVGTPPESRDRGTLDPLRSDFTLARGRTGTLRVAVPAGVHDLALLRGDATGTSGATVVQADGQTLVPAGGNLAAGEFAWERFTLDGGATGRTVDLVISNDAGNYWRLCALIMVPRVG
ncbi:discoidin domain-containing protein [Micromonospora sp. WMMD812]|uniref:discoidin domain-containing protein n=1 Tax=Micromonospora sp. WMMD812 TaxID=3015152 RepID=UPI00248AE662|nr:discoidin domain-containing protein [Micromonospora sp. WMMD812]WBB70744.1 discoidin domain-containing protein [Micromonospora sp. WMMD812]